MNFKYLKMEAECARLCSSLQLSHGFLQCHDLLQRAGWKRPLCRWLVRECQGRRQLQQGCNTARTWKTRPMASPSSSVSIISQKDIWMAWRQTHTSSSNKQGQLSGVWLSAGPYEHDDLVVCVFRNVSAVDEHNQVSFHESRLTSTGL